MRRCWMLGLRGSMISLLDLSCGGIHTTAATNSATGSVTGSDQ